MNTNTETLYTKRLILRRFMEPDAGDIFKIWASDERVTKYLSFMPHDSINTTQMKLDEWIKAYIDDDGIGLLS